MTLLEVFDVMRNHVNNEVANQCLAYLLSEYKVNFKVYIFVSPNFINIIRTDSK